jgi:hypothetical protein
MHKVILRRVRESFLLWKSNKYYIFLCARARPSLRVGARTRGGVAARTDV